MDCAGHGKAQKASLKALSGAMPPPYHFAQAHMVAGNDEGVVKMSGIGTCLWFDSEAEEAANFYVNLFPNSHIGEVNRYPEGPMGEPGSVLTVSFVLDGRNFTALNGGPMYTFSEAISFELSFESQEELDEKWFALIANGGEESMCGWLKDKYGVSWQLVPTMLSQLLGGTDPEGAQRAMQAMLGMRRLVIADLQAAYDG